jgi:sterol desaturase/sphingolipid hydroxylase (fatty acid hydroxylase superfamily)
VGLSIHGIVVPIFQTAVVFGLLSTAFPSAKGTLHIPPLMAFFINFVVVDYLYYWNHRLLHDAKLWRFHAVHHSGKSFDVFTTSRNSAITTFLILYIWVNGAFLFFLHDPFPYALAILLSNCLDLVRHSGSNFWPQSLVGKLITSPRDHSWHHSAELHGVNFGGNFTLWDRLHGTYYESKELPNEFGTPIERQSLWKAFWKGA